MCADVVVTQDTRAGKPLQKWAVIAILAFIPFGFVGVAPCMCPEGPVRSHYELILYLFVLIRLLFGLSRRDLKVADFALWIGAYAAFFIYVESL